LVVLVVVVVVLTRGTWLMHGNRPAGPPSMGHPNADRKKERPIFTFSTICLFAARIIPDSESTSQFGILTSLLLRCLPKRATTDSTYPD
jgi:hypothetical protein